MKNYLFTLLSVSGLMTSVFASDFELRLGESKNVLKIDGQIAKDEYSGGAKLFGMVLNRHWVVHPYCAKFKQKKYIERKRK